MNILDVIIVVLLVFAFVRGFVKGFFVEVASLVALVGGIWGAIHFSYFAVALLEDYVDWDKNYILLVAFAITFIAIALGISYLGKGLTKMADIVALGLVNKVMGGIFAFLKSLVIISVALVFFTKLNNTITIVKKSTLENSVLYVPVESVVQVIFPSITRKFETEQPKVKEHTASWESLKSK